jgi:hypothetical protein
VFGKLLEFRKRSAVVSRGEQLPDDVTSQFKTDVLEKGLQLAETSRILHINFGRESYFGLVVDSSAPKGVYVHATVNPETKLLARAACGCFRASTRTYCHHIVTFVRYILRADPDTGRLHTLEEDFGSSFWREIGWYGYKNFGDSILGFKAQVNHGGEGLRLTFSDRGSKEILTFMAGERLVEEFLPEFFDLIRRDIDPVLFKRMYGRKLKDLNVPSQRRRPWSYTDSEDELNRRGLKSTLQHYEESIWHRVAKAGFLIAGRDGGSFHFTFLEHKQELVAEGVDEDDSVILRLVPPRNHIGAIIELAEKKEVIGHDLPIHPLPLKTGYRLELTESSALCIVPIVENPDPDAAPEDQYLDRTGLEARLFGSYYFFPGWGFMKIAVSASGLPAEYFSAQKRITIHADKITGFLAEYGDLLKGEPCVLADPALFQRQTLEKYDMATAELQESSDGSVSLGVHYDFGEFRLSFKEIYEARKNKKRFLIKGDKWVDALSPHFAWMDGLDASVTPDDAETLHMRPAEYLRFLAFHEGIEKRFASGKVRGWFEKLESLKAPGRLPSIKAMQGKLRGYQKNGFGWLWFLYENGFSGLLCDDMGLGKTHQVMALMTGILSRNAERASSIRYLVVCPTTVLSHWKDRVVAFSPHLDPYIHHGTDRSFRQGFDEHRLIITSYGIALRDVEMLADYRFELMVLDEVQAVKNKTTKTYSAVKALDAACTIGLTGTPIENSLVDLKSLFDIILPGYMMSDAFFDRSFREPIEDAGDKDCERRLVRLVQPFTLRRTKDQVLKELPAKIVDVRRCNRSDDQVRFYRDVTDNQGQEIVQTLKDPEKKVPYMHIFAVLNYLKQICNHPASLDAESKDYKKYESGKWDLFVELLQESLGSGQKVVVFSQYVKMLALIEAYLQDEGIRFATIKGQTRKRAEAIETFNKDPNCMVFSASLRAAGLGIDLTAASVVIHYDRWWNSAREEQATDRVHRIGQKRGVHVFKLITQDTLEEKIDSIIARKKQLMDSIVKEDDQSLLKHFSREDLIELISF